MKNNTTKKQHPNKPTHSGHIMEHIPQWAHTALGTPIELFKIALVEPPKTHAKTHFEANTHEDTPPGGNTHDDDTHNCLENSKPLLFIGGVHGDEPEGVYLAQSFLRWIQNHLTEVQQNCLLIPILNPDGFQKNQRTNSQGVDLNRNYPASNWSPEYSKDRYFPGYAPGDQKETQALVDLILKYNPCGIIHFHSWKPCVVCTGHPGLRWATPLAQASGFTLTDSIGYETPGSLSQFGWVDHKIPVICTEDEEHQNAELSWKHFGPGLIEILTNSQSPIIAHPIHHPGHQS